MRYIFVCIVVIYTLCMVNGSCATKRSSKIFRLSRNSRDIPSDYENHDVHYRVKRGMDHRSTTTTEAPTTTTRAPTTTTQAPTTTTEAEATTEAETTSTEEETTTYPPKYGGSDEYNGVVPVFNTGSAYIDHDSNNTLVAAPVYNYGFSNWPKYLPYHNNYNHQPPKQNTHHDYNSHYAPV